MELAERTAKWLNMPRQATVTDRKIVIYTEPETDFWQDTYYGFQRNSGHALLVDSDEKTTFSVKDVYKRQTSGRQIRSLERMRISFRAASHFYPLCR